MIPTMYRMAQTIHDLPLDAPVSKFYSVPIFDTLATSAIPVAVSKRTPRALCSLRLLVASDSHSPLSNKQQSTQNRLTEVSTLLDQKIPGNHPRY
jgi:hypothetical protein